MITRRRIATAVSLIATGVIVVPGLYVRHRNDIDLIPNAPPARAEVAAAAPDASAEITSDLQKRGIPLEGVTVTWIDGIVILRGTVDSASAGTRIAEAIHAEGYKRVANMIQLAPPVNDDTIRRDVERRLTETRGLDGCHFTVSSNKGVLKVAGTVQSDSQEAEAREILRGVHQARQVETDLRRAGDGL